MLYKAYETFKDELTSVLNHPLMPSEFERAWRDLVGKYDLKNDEIMKALWTDREEWISAYYKEVFCAWMTSTQRSESMNRILKRNFVRERHDLHIFASQVDRCIQTRKGNKHAETMANDLWYKKMQFSLCMNKNEMKSVMLKCSSLLHKKSIIFFVNQKTTN